MKASRVRRGGTAVAPLLMLSLVAACGSSSDGATSDEPVSGVAERTAETPVPVTDLTVPLPARVQKQTEPNTDLTVPGDPLVPIVGTAPESPENQDVEVPDNLMQNLNDPSTPEGAVCWALREVQLRQLRELVESTQSEAGVELSEFTQQDAARAAVEDLPTTLHGATESLKQTNSELARFAEALSSQLESVAARGANTYEDLPPLDQLEGAEAVERLAIERPDVCQL